MRICIYIYMYICIIIQIFNRRTNALGALTNPDKPRQTRTNPFLGLSGFVWVCLGLSGFVRAPSAPPSQRTTLVPL